jgi:hypothetical protein
MERERARGRGKEEMAEKFVLLFHKKNQFGCKI